MPKKNSTRKKSTGKKTKPTPLSQPPAAQEFINITETAPDAASKRRIIWLVAIASVIILTVAWFFSLRYNVAQIAGEVQKWQLERTAKDSVNKITDALNSTTSPASAAAEQERLLAIKNQVIAQIKDNLDNSVWPTHISALGVNLQYPDFWFKNDGANLLTLSSYNLSSTTPETFGQMTIMKKTNAQKLTLDKWVEKISTIKDGGYKLEAGELKIGGQSAFKYVKTEKENFSWLIYTATEITKKDNYVYEINIASQNGLNLYEPLFNQILTSIKFATTTTK